MKHILIVKEKLKVRLMIWLLFPLTSFRLQMQLQDYANVSIFSHKNINARRHHWLRLTLFNPTSNVTVSSLLTKVSTAKLSDGMS